MMSQLVALVLWAVCITSSLASLPKYIETCKESSPDINKCIVEKGMKALPGFINGDPEFSVPKLNPLYMEEVKINQGRENFGLTITLKKVNMHGLENLQFTEARNNMKASHAEWDFFFPKLELIGKYSIKGRILLLPIFGDGDANITLTNVKVTFKQNWTLQKRKGNEYAKLKDTDLDFTTDQTYFRFEKLFNGDKLLGENMNLFLNENWREVMKDVSPAIGKTFSELATKFLQAVFDKAPFNEAFPK